MRLVLATALLAASAGLGATTAAAEDGRFLTLDFSQGGLFHVPTSPQSFQTVLFEQGEQIRSVIISDPGAYVIQVSGRGDSLALRPNGPTALAVMSVRTDRRSYELELTPGEADKAPEVVRFSYSPQARPQRLAPVRAAPRQASTWRLGGAQRLRPEQISDDGSKTYITWGEHQAMPAIFAAGATGREEIVDGYMRDGVFTLDSVHEELVFRIDKERATARRQLQGNRHERD